MDKITDRMPSKKPAAVTAVQVVVTGGHNAKESAKEVLGEAYSEASKTYYEIHAALSVAKERMASAKDTYAAAKQAALDAEEAYSQSVTQVNAVMHDLLGSADALANAKVSYIKAGL